MNLKETSNAEVSIVIPCRNEENFIGAVLDNILSQDYPQHLIEVFVIDGISDDATCSIVEEYARKYPSIKLLENKYKIVPPALNKGIKAAKGEVIIRMDAHSVYPNNYVSRLVDQLFELKADNVGGVWDTTPQNDSLVAKCIAWATSHPFGIGNAQYRLENDQVKKVDTVPFGCYRRDVFDRIGYFDEELVRNQDDEFNARLIKKGGSIYLVPDVHITYFARPNIPKMAKMFYQYGLFKPLVNRKVGSPATIRQFVPPGLVLANLFLLLLMPFHILFVALFGLMWLMYGGGCLYFSLKLALSKNNLSAFFILPLVFISIHFSYGIGYVKGIVKHLVVKSNVETNAFDISR